MMISLENWRFGSLHVVCDDDKFGSLEVYILCVMLISLEVCKVGCLHIVCDVDKFGSLQGWMFTYCVW